jgi:uncharacterized protein (DUF433 family)
MVVASPEVLSGTPVVRGTRIPVYDVAASVAAGVPMNRVLAAYPSLDGDKLDLATLYGVVLDILRARAASALRLACRRP